MMRFHAPNPTLTNGVKMKQPDFADRSWLIKDPKIAADVSVKTLVAGMLTILAITLWVF
jgi:hypothetical protein